MPADSPTPLTATPSSAKALAAAGAGETVTLWVPFEREPVWEEEPSLSDAGTWVGRYALGEVRCDTVREWVEVDEHAPPVAEGERVAVAYKCETCRGLGGDRWMERDGSERGERCDDCRGFGSVYVEATVLATPAPEKCETCEDGKVWECDNHLCWMAVCPDCVGRLWRWRVEVRREGSDQWLT